MKYNPLDPLGHTYDEWRPSKLNFMDGDGGGDGDSGAGDGGFDSDGTGFGDFGLGFDSGFGGLSDGGFDAGNFGGFGDAVAGDSLGFDDSGGSFGGFSDTSGGSFGGFGDTSAGDSLGFGPSGDFGFDSGGNFGGFGDSLGFDSGGNFGGFDSGSFGFDSGNFGVDNLASNDFFGNFIGGPDNLGNFGSFDNFGPTGWESTFGNNMTADWGLSGPQAAAQSFGWGPGDYAAFAGMNSAPVAGFGPESGFYGLDTTGRGAPSFDEAGFISNPAPGAPGFNLGGIFNQDPNATPSMQFGPMGPDLGDLYNSGPFSDPTGGAKAAPGFETRGDLGPQDPAAANFFSSLGGLVSEANAQAAKGDLLAGAPYGGPNPQTANMMNTQTLDDLRSEFGYNPAAVQQGLMNAQQAIADERADAEFNNSLSGALSHNLNAMPTITAASRGPDLGDLYNTGPFTDPTGGAQGAPATAFGPANQSVHGQTIPGGIQADFANWGPSYSTGVAPGAFQTVNQADPMADPTYSGFPSAAVMGKGDEYSQVGLAPNNFMTTPGELSRGAVDDTVWGPMFDSPTAPGVYGTGIGGPLSDTGQVVQTTVNNNNLTDPNQAPGWVGNYRGQPQAPAQAFSPGDMRGQTLDTIFGDRGVGLAQLSTAMNNALQDSPQTLNTDRGMSQDMVQILVQAGIPIDTIQALVQLGLNDNQIIAMAQDGTLNALMDSLSQR